MRLILNASRTAALVCNSCVCVCVCVCVWVCVCVRAIGVSAVTYIKPN